MLATNGLELGWIFVWEFSKTWENTLPRQYYDAITLNGCTDFNLSINVCKMLHHTCPNFTSRLTRYAYTRVRNLFGVVVLTDITSLFRLENYTWNAKYAVLLCHKKLQKSFYSSKQHDTICLRIGESNVIKSFYFLETYYFIYIYVFFILWGIFGHISKLTYI